MDKIKQIAISGFQSLYNVVLDLGSITVVIGESRQGKSALKRALEGFVTNKPARGHVSDNGDKKDSVVVVTTETGVAGWRKGKNNRYQVNSEIYDRVGASCPEQVTDFLSIKEMQFGTNVKILPNFHSQFDKPFIVDKTGTVIAKVFGEATNIGKLILATKEARSRKLDNSNVMNVKSEDLQELVVKIPEYDCVPQARSFLEGAKALFVKVKECKDTIESAQSLYEMIVNSERDLQHVENSINSAVLNLKAFDGLDDAHEKIVGRLSRLAELETLMDERIKWSRFVEYRTECLVGCDKQKALLNSLSSLDVDGLLRDLNVVDTQLIKMSVFEASWMECNEAIKKSASDYELQRARLDRLNEAVKASEKEQGFCPLCERAFE